MHGNVEGGEIAAERTVAAHHGFAVPARAPQRGQEADEMGGPAPASRRRHHVQDAHRASLAPGPVAVRCMLAAHR